MPEHQIVQRNGAYVVEELLEYVIDVHLVQPEQQQQLMEVVELLDQRDRLMEHARLPLDLLLAARRFVVIQNGRHNEHFQNLLDLLDDVLVRNDYMIVDDLPVRWEQTKQYKFGRSDRRHGVIGHLPVFRQIEILQLLLVLGGCIRFHVLLQTAVLLQ